MTQPECSEQMGLSFIETQRWVRFFPNTILERENKVSFPNIHYLRAEQPHQSATDLMAHFEGVIEGVGKDIKEKLASILCVLNDQPGLRTTMLSSKTDIPVKSIERYVKRLKDAGLIKYSGSSKSGGYFLSDSIVRE